MQASGRGPWLGGGEVRREDGEMNEMDTVSLSDERCGRSKKLDAPIGKLG